MSDLLTDAGIVAGVDPASVEVMREYLRNMGAYVTIDYEAQYRRQAAEETARARAAGDAMPDYHGAITQCQASVHGQRVTMWRCQRKATKVRRDREQVMAVCITHARAKYTPSKYSREEVEREYR